MYGVSSHRDLYRLDIADATPAAFKRAADPVAQPLSPTCGQAPVIQLAHACPPASLIDHGQETRAKELGLTGGALRAHRRIYIRPIADELLAWMNAVGPTLLPTDPLAQAIRYCKNHRAALLRFIDDAALPIDNSPTERLFQNVAKLRLNMLFAGSTEGAHRACVLLGITATCRAIGVPALVYLTWAFERLGTHRDLYGLDAADLTPAAFKQRA